MTAVFRYDGDGRLLRLGLQAHALGIGWEFDPYFELSVSRVDPLPHQLEAVYDHLLKLALVGTTTLDRVHTGMLLQTSGRTNALQALVQAEQERGPDFRRLSNALSALYPRGSEEKRLLDAMLLAVPR